MAAAAVTPQTVRMAERLPDEAIPLFREDPERFVSARDAFVAELRSHDRPDDAAAVKALRRPTAVVWAVNQLSDRDPDAVRALLEAGAELRSAQQATLSSSASGAERLRAAAAARRSAVSRLAALAGEMLTAAGRGARSDEIAAALEAASVDEETGRSLAAGMLTGSPEHASGFGDVFGLTALEGGGGTDEGPASGGGPGEANAAAPTRRAAASGAADQRRTEARDEIARLRRDREAAARRARTARDAADRIAIRLDGMRERLAATEADHAEADARARGADIEAARAERALEAAVRRLERLGEADP